MRQADHENKKCESLKTWSVPYLGSRRSPALCHYGKPSVSDSRDTVQWQEYEVLLGYCVTDTAIKHQPMGAIVIFFKHEMKT